MGTAQWIMILMLIWEFVATLYRARNNTELMEYPSVVFAGTFARIGVLIWVLTCGGFWG